MKLTKRLLCVLLAIVLLIGIVPTRVFAASDEAASSAASPPGTEAAAPQSPETAEESPPIETAMETTAETTPPETTPEATAEVTSPETIPEATAAETAPETIPETTGEPITTTAEENNPETTDSSEAPAQEDSAFGLLTDATYAVSERAALKYTGTLGLFERAKVDFNGITISAGNDNKSDMLILGLRDLAIDWSNFTNYPYGDAAGTAVYCIEPGVGIGYSGYEGATVTIEDVWRSLSPDQQRTIGLILLYGAPNMPTAGSNDKDRFTNEIINEFVTAIMIHEVIHGWRDVTMPYSHNSSSKYYKYVLGDDYHNLIFTSNLTGLTAPDGTSISLWKKSISVAQVKEAYNYLETKLAQHNAYPSFTSDSIKKAPTHTMAKQADGSYTVTLTDTSEQGAVKNGLYNWEALASSLSANGGSLTVNQSAGQVTITAPCFSAIPTGLITVTRDDIPNPATSTYLVWSSSTGSGQTVMQVKDGKYDPVPAYFKLTGESGYLNITKTTSDGSNLAGWQFGVYEDAACTKLLVGPLTTDDTGKITSAAIPVGTVYVKEIGHTNAAINALYVCTGSNPQKVNATLGSTYNLTFTNKLKPGTLEIRKTTNTGTDLGGWQFEIYSDAACTNKVSGPHTTGDTGSIGTISMEAGIYYVKELGNEDTNVDAMYSCEGENPQRIEISSGSKTVVTFANKLKPGTLEIRKETNTGTELGGWVFHIYTDAACTVEVDGSPFVTDESGLIVQNLNPGTYYIAEEPSSDPYWICDDEVKSVTVEAGKSSSVTFTNRKLGRIGIQKHTNTGADRDGWKFGIYDAEENLVDTITTDSSGKGTSKWLLPGNYTVKEIGSVDGKFSDKLWIVDSDTEYVTVTVGNETSVSFDNIHTGEVKIIKTIVPAEDDTPISDDIAAEASELTQREASGELAGWQFLLTDSSGTQYGPYVTDDNGEITVSSLMPGTYTVEEIIPDGSLYVCVTDNPQTVDVTAGDVAEVRFSNRLRTGSIEIRKTDNYSNPLAGATFLLEWSVDGNEWNPVTYSARAEAGSCFAGGLENGCLTSGEDGLIVFDGLHPGLIYRVTETKAPNGYSLKKGTVYEGSIPADTLLVSLTVVNKPEPDIPQTGDRGGIFLPLLGMAISAMGLFLMIRKRAFM